MAEKRETVPVKAGAPDIVVAALGAFDDWADPGALIKQARFWVAEAQLSSYERAAFLAFVREAGLFGSKFTDRQWRSLYDRMRARPITR